MTEHVARLLRDWAECLPEPPRPGYQPASITYFTSHVSDPGATAIARGLTAEEVCDEGNANARSR